MNNRAKSSNPIRRELAYNAAKLIAVDGITDYFFAKKKAAQKLGIDQSKFFPSNKEIEEALIEYQNIFQKEGQPKALKTLRIKALNALELFESLEPYLVGPIVTGTANEHSEIIIHVFSESPQAISILLMDNGIPFEECERRARFKGHETKFYPAFQFYADQHKVILLVLPERKKNNPPLDPVSGQSIERANYRDLKKLINSD